MAQRLPKAILQALLAMEEFLSSESDLLALDVNERSLTHKLAEYVQRQFGSWDVDCEYNRLGDAVKRLPRARPVRTDDAKGRTIFPDIIVHKRGKRRNLLVIEAKKTTNNERADDEDKLVGLTSRGGDYGYTFGLHLILDCDACRVADLTVYANGAVDESLTETVRARL